MNFPGPGECGCWKCSKEYDDKRWLIVIQGTSDWWDKLSQSRCNRFIACDICGNKRCPHATDHNLTCTDSNETGQEGSRYA